ncbi:ceramide-1-phosphate transfer protein [Engraulis encrasicolus]|uniref:ceramide-1-phosphate transfer protein n=1 Tax=Engraulis encrasicolus TaxID=184585 RepID=UPI002FD635EF
MRPLLRVYLLPAAILALMLFLSSYWLPQGSPQGCDSLWRPCLSVYQSTSKPKPQAGHDWAHGGDVLVGECPGQDFQVSRLFLHLTSALGPGSDVLLDEYLSSWEELIKFMNALGPLVSFFSHKVQEKITVLRELSSSSNSTAASVGDHHQLDHDGGGGAASVRERPRQSRSGAAAPYRSVLSMLDYELRSNLVDFHRETPSGSRTLLRLHRSLLWLRLLLDKLCEGDDIESALRSPGELCREAYREALAPHHPWLLRQAAEVAFGAMPPRRVFLELVCVRSQRRATPVMRTLARAIQEVHARTQRALEQRGMLELP